MTRNKGENDDDYEYCLFFTYYATATAALLGEIMGEGGA